jgi:hypothetical protein
LNTRFHLRLDDEGIDHDWQPSTFGTHDWHHWERYLQEAMAFVVESFASPRARPEAFDYRSADDSFAAWGWSFTVHRAEQAFVDLTGVSRAGLTAVGRGALEVRTPPCFSPGDEYTVGSRLVTADDAGRLHFVVELQGSGASVSIANASSSTATRRSTATSAC